MNRAHPIFSRSGCLGGLGQVAGVVIAIAVSGGALFSPGELTALADNTVPAQPIASHAQIGNDCGQCHAPFAGITAERCQACHTSVSQQRAAGTGVHGAMPAREVTRCASCHADHQGREFDPSAAARLRFAHTTVGFSLAQHAVDYEGRPMECASCHPRAGHRFEAPACVACHDGSDNLANFEHALVFPLDGAHAALACTTCHLNHVFRGTPRDCAGCHAEPAIHAGLFGLDCAECHSTNAWAPALVAGHRFPLDHGDEGIIACAVCHTDTVFTYTCTNCHEHEPADVIEEHAEEGIVGPDLLACAACHPQGEKD